MEPKIPISNIVNLNNEDNSLIYKIKCSFCGGVLLDPLYSKKDNKIYCKECFYKLYYIDKNNQDIDIGKLYNKIEIRNINEINKLKYYCPQCIKNNNNNENKVEYTYNSLMNHLITCPNKVILKKLCKNYNCDKKIDIYLKDIDKKENIEEILLNNYILEKEIEKEKLQLNFPNYKKYLNSQANDIKNVLINKKRKHETNEYNGTNVNKNIGSKSKKIGSKNNKLNSNTNKNIGEISTKKFEKSNNNMNLVDICQHWKGNFKSLFSCCDKEYGCVDCHFNNEQHHLVFSGEILCLLCNKKYKGDKCPFCLVEKIQKRKQIF